jgi:centrosomal protein CEP76
MINKFVCSYIRPLRTGRLLDSPRLASRFVSLIGYNKKDLSFCTNQNIEQLLNMHTFLVKNCGNSDNHSILLCSLLLGYGLDAYVCLGTKSKNHPHSWVVTISFDFKEIIFWESLTGNRYIHSIVDPYNLSFEKNIIVNHPYKTIGCLFNHKSFYANIQLLSNVDTCSFDLKDSSKWKAISQDAINTVNIPTQYFPPLCENDINSEMVSNDLEIKIKALINDRRKEIGLNTFWDDNLSYILGSALYSYETERITGISMGNEEFDQAIKLIVPEGHFFKAFPIQTISLNAKKNLTLCLKSTTCEEIIFCKGDQVKLALTIRVFSYPESAIATWIMIACIYKAV